MSALWQPYWVANTAYLATAVVIPTTGEQGYTWRCTTAGTSGNVEPSWPADPSVTPTVTDGSVTWTVGTAFRQAFQDALVGTNGIVTNFMAANPTIIRGAGTVRPLAFANVPLPYFYLDDLDETYTYMQGVRQRLAVGALAYLVDATGSIDESNDRFNFAVDCLVDLFGTNVHAISGRSIFQHTATNDTSFPEGGTVYQAAEFQFGLTGVLEGRI